MGIRLGTSPVGARRHNSGEDSTSNMARPVAVRLGTSMLGIRTSPESQNLKSGCHGAFNNMRSVDGSANFFPNNQSFSTHQPAVFNTQNSYPSQSSHQVGPSYQNLPSSSQQNLSANSSHLSANSSHLSANSSHLSANSPHIAANNSHPSANSSVMSGNSSYLTANSPHLSANSSHLSANSSHLSANSTHQLSEEAELCGEARPEPAPPSSRVWCPGTEPMLQTPSPSDSGVGELEAMLREKDAEMNTLREVMDRNERAILQVYEERRHAWLQDSHELKEDYERRLKVQSRKSYKTEQVLSLQVYKLQQEHKLLLDEKAKFEEENNSFKQQLEENRDQIAQLKSQLENRASPPVNSSQVKGNNSDKETDSSQDETVLKSKEIITLKSELHALESEIENKNKELLERARETSINNDKMSKMKEELSRLRNPAVLTESSSQTHVPSEVSVSENIKPSALTERDRTIDVLKDDVQAAKTDIELLKIEQEKEREQWLEEKNKVVRYQKQLQLNYVQMQRKNAALETEVQQLTLELENRDMKLIALDGEESVC